ncbi:substrate binding domain-containing protein [Endozoicomonas sp. SCSIO W0465]|uniref:substrate binding domain-containing protein n=1 Tax=Endozoicomonas sp. SCSIO W0465 TaxID=2918516 RepID=UPI002075969F|nr:substrate binding domain-containing protein [Endozoicomonas sp. SCSIO W0465]USE36228.1 substrate binding domain-containing protein [Endozoicomonas sp. SCSIO W0465]
MDSFVDEPRGRVRICCTPIFAQSVLLPVINAFNRRYRKVRFSLDINPYGLSQYCRYDLIINAETSYQPQENPTLPLVKRNLLTEPFVLVASTDYLTARQPIHHPEQLQEHTCLYADSLTHSRQWAFSKESQVRLINISDNLEVSDTNLLFDAAKMGMGIAYLPRYVVESSIRSGQLEKLLPDYQTAHWMLNLYYPEVRQMDQGCVLFKDFFLSTYRDQLNKPSRLSRLVPE